MVVSSGSFGLLKPRYEITDDRVTLSRDVWLPVALLALGAPGGFCLAQAFGHRHFDGTLFGLGLIGTMIGLFALVMTPWLLPGRITCTREGLAWGSVRYPCQAIQSVRALSTDMRSSRYGRYLSWTIVVALADQKPLIVALGNRNRATSTKPLAALERAMAAMLCRRP
jgi:hypothetical protein